MSRRRLTQVDRRRMADNEREMFLLALGFFGDQRNVELGTCRVRGFHVASRGNPGKYAASVDVVMDRPTSPRPWKVLRSLLRWIALSMSEAHMVRAKAAPDDDRMFHGNVWADGTVRFTMGFDYTENNVAV